jgi:hypothetical protein
MLKSVNQFLLENFHFRGVAILVLGRMLNRLTELLFLRDSASYRFLCFWMC